MHVGLLVLLVAAEASILASAPAVNYQAEDGQRQRVTGSRGGKPLPNPLVGSHPVGYPGNIVSRPTSHRGLGRTGHLPNEGGDGGHFGVGRNLVVFVSHAVDPGIS